ncbi:MAG: hypothetical protein ACK40G_17300 [Cytophagaceae bacterium]
MKLIIVTAAKTYNLLILKSLHDENTSNSFRLSEIEGTDFFRDFKETFKNDDGHQIDHLKSMIESTGFDLKDCSNPFIILE